MPSKKSRSPKPTHRDPKAVLVRTATLLDFARFCCLANGGSAFFIAAVKSGSSYRLFQVGERVDRVRVVYYYQNPSLSKFGVYNPGVDSAESFRLTDDIKKEAPDYKLYKAPIMEIEALPYKLGEHKTNISLIKAKDFHAMVRAIIVDSGSDLEPIRLYGFFSGKQHIIGTFVLLRDQARAFTYAVAENNNLFSSLSYDYTTDALEVSNSLPEKSRINMRVINLAEPFPFFKPE